MVTDLFPDFINDWAVLLERAVEAAEELPEPFGLTDVQVRARVSSAIAGAAITGLLRAGLLNYADTYEPRMLFRRAHQAVKVLP